MRLPLPWAAGFATLLFPYSAQPIIKSLLDVADNLQRAGDAVPGGVLDGSEQLDAEKAQRLLKSLLEGVKMTEGVLMKVRRCSAHDTRWAGHGGGMHGGSSSCTPGSLAVGASC